jgi:hypothetical protein
LISFWIVPAVQIRAFMRLSKKDTLQKLYTNGIGGTESISPGVFEKLAGNAPDFYVAARGE